MGAFSEERKKKINSGIFFNFLWFSPIIYFRVAASRVRTSLPNLHPYYMQCRLYPNLLSSSFIVFVVLTTSQLYGNDTLDIERQCRKLNEEIVTMIRFLPSFPFESSEGFYEKDLSKSC